MTTVNDGNKQKPRICELLNVEVGERFRVESESCILYSEAFVDDDGVVRASIGQAMDGMRICQLISGELRIVQKIHFREEEISDAKAIMRLLPWGEKIVRTDIGKLCLIGHRPNKWTERELIGESLFPSIRPGQYIDLLEIVGDERMTGHGCKTCPVRPCDASYRGSRCAAYRDRLGLGDPKTEVDKIREMSDEELEELIAKINRQSNSCDSNA